MVLSIDNTYFVNTIVRAFKNLSDTSNWMCLVREQFKQTIQAIKFTKMLAPVNSEQIKEKSLTLPPLKKK